MASAFPSRGVDDPAARLAVRSLGMGTLGPGGEVGGGVAVAVDDQAAAGTAKDPLGQPHLSSDIAAHRANLGGCKPAVADDQLGAEPRCLVGELAGELGPGDITDGTGQTPVGDEVGNGEVFQTEPVVGLDELAGDLVEKVSTDVGDVGVLPGQAPDRLGPVARAGPGRRDVMRQPAEAHHAAMQRHGCSEAADLGPVRSRCHSERDEASVQPNKPVIAGRSGQVATVGVQVGGLHVEADIPAGPVPTTVANRILARGAILDCPVPVSSWATGRNSRRSRRVSSWTRTTPIVGRVTERGRPSPMRIEQPRPLPCLLRSRKLSRQRPLRFHLGKPTRTLCVSELLSL